MSNSQSKLLGQARASEAQVALIELANLNKRRRGLGVPMLATCMPVILACAVVILVRQGMEDQTGFVISKTVHPAATVQQAAANP